MYIHICLCTHVFIICTHVQLNSIYSISTRIMSIHVYIPSRRWGDDSKPAHNFLPDAAQAAQAATGTRWTHGPTTS